MPLSLVLFDLDDVLCGYDREARVRDLAARAGLSAPEVEAALWDSGFEDEADRGRFTAEQYLDDFGRRLGLALTREQWVANRKAAMTPWPSMLALVRRVQERVECALFTTNGPLFLETLETLFPELLPLFGRQNIHVSCELKALKSEPRAFALLLARRRAAAEQTLFLDDSEFNVAAAREAGLQAEVFTDQAAAERLLRENGAL